MFTVDLPSKSAVSTGAGQHVAALRQFLVRAQKAVPIAGEVSVLLTSDRAVRRLNREFLGKDQATDVLSFPALAFAKSNSRSRQPHNIVAGDLAISVETAARQAKQCGHPLPVELKILLLHGLLHLAGHDHETDAGEMAVLEEQLRRRFRLPHTLIARSIREGRAKTLPARSRDSS